MIYCNTKIWSACNSYKHENKPMSATIICSKIWSQMQNMTSASISSLTRMILLICGNYCRIWKKIVRRGDAVVDATCGNGYDTVALLRMIADDSRKGCVYGLDIQNSALENTSYLLRESVVEEQRELVKLSLLCHSRMEDILPKDTPLRLIAFNLGYLPGADKDIVTKPHTTVLALQAACRIIASGGLVSIVAYVGHPGGREEVETVLSFASSLPAEGWNCFKFEAANRPTGPVLVFIFKK